MCRHKVKSLEDCAVEELSQAHRTNSVAEGIEQSTQINAVRVISQASFVSVLRLQLSQSIYADVSDITMLPINHGHQSSLLHSSWHYYRGQTSRCYGVERSSSFTWRSAVMQWVS